MIVDYLRTASVIIEWRRTHPEIAGPTSIPPIVIVGQRRTGTTILHDLLAQDPANRVPLTWEVDRPIPPPETATYDTDPRIAEVAGSGSTASSSFIPGFQAMHPMGARLAQECVRITGGDFRSMIFPTQYRVPSYVRWLLDEADMAPAYRWHRHVPAAPAVAASRRALGAEVARAPVGLGALLAEYPNALLVQTHRDPLRIIASLASLMRALRRLGQRRDLDARRGGRVRRLHPRRARPLGRRRAKTARSRPTASSTCSSARSWPIRSRRSARSTSGSASSSPDESEQRMRAFLADNPTDKHGGHHYTFADTGLDDGACASGPAGTRSTSTCRPSNSTDRPVHPSAPLAGRG